MENEVITKKDLDDFKEHLLKELESIIARNGSVKPWLKAKEVKRLLSMSDGTLQNLRIHGQLKSVKIGGVHYYRYEDIRQLMNGASAKET